MDHGFRRGEVTKTNLAAILGKGGLDSEMRNTKFE